MIKHYCDVCGEETKRNFVSDRLQRHHNEWRVEIMVGHKDLGWNSGDICLTCLLNVINQGTEPPNKYAADSKKLL
jgi:hypothetical protein